MPELFPEPFPEPFPKLDADWLALHHPIPNANFHQSLPCYIDFSPPPCPQDFPEAFPKPFPKTFPELDADWLAPNQPIVNAKFPPITALLDRSTYHKKFIQLQTQTFTSLNLSHWELMLVAYLFSRLVLSTLPIFIHTYHIQIKSLFRILVIPSLPNINHICHTQITYNPVHLSSHHVLIFSNIYPLLISHYS